MLSVQKMFFPIQSYARPSIEVISVNMGCTSMGGCMHVCYNEKLVTYIMKIMIMHDKVM